MIDVSLLSACPRLDNRTADGKWRTHLREPVQRDVLFPASFGHSLLTPIAAAGPTTWLTCMPGSFWISKPRQRIGPRKWHQAGQWSPALNTALPLSLIASMKTRPTVRH